MAASRVADSRLAVRSFLKQQLSWELKQADRALRPWAGLVHAEMLEAQAAAGGRHVDVNACLDTLDPNILFDHVHDTMSENALSQGTMMQLLALERVHRIRIVLFSPSHSPEQQYRRSLPSQQHDGCDSVTEILVAHVWGSWLRGEPEARAVGAQGRLDHWVSVSDPDFAAAQAEPAMPVPSAHPSQRQSAGQPPASMLPQAVTQAVTQTEPGRAAAAAAAATRVAQCHASGSNQLHAPLSTSGESPPVPDHGGGTPGASAAQTAGTSGKGKRQANTPAAGAVRQPSQRRRNAP